MRLRSKSLLLALLSAASTIRAADDAAPRSLEELRSRIERVLSETGAPGAAVAVVSRDRVELVAGFGLADRSSKRPVTPATLFRIASLSREFAALAALKLQEDGKLKLTDTLRQWVPEIPVQNAWEPTDPIRLEHLLEHTSGLPDKSFAEMASNDPTPLTLTQALAFAPQRRVTRWRPGTRYAYSGLGPPLIAAVVEKATGRQFEDYVRDNLFLPLGMTSASYFVVPNDQPELATMYWVQNHDVAPYSHSIYRASTSVVASITDMANYLRFHLRRGTVDGRSVLSAVSMDRLEQSTTLPAARAGVTVGHGLFNDGGLDSRGIEWRGHTGSTDAALSSMYYSTELGMGLAVLTNSNDDRAYSGIERLLFTYITRDATARPTPSPAPMPATLNRGFAGYYANIAPRDEGFRDFGEYYTTVFRAQVEESGMTWQPVLGGPAQSWVPVSDKLFRLEKHPKPSLALIEGENGEPLVQFGPFTLRRISAVGFWLDVGSLAAALAVLATAIISALVWFPRRLWLPPARRHPLGVRTGPLIGAFAVLAAIVFFISVQSGHLGIVGTRNAWTLGLMLDSLIIPLSALFGTIAAWRARGAQMSRVVYWHAVAATGALWIVSAFLVRWDLVGVRLWA